MRLWFAPDSEVPLYHQLVTQIVLAILSGDLQPGDRLPSTRELSRRFAIHPNTISTGYRHLEREGWAELRHGSGVYVRTNTETPSTPEQVLDVHIAALFRKARELGLPTATVRARLSRWLAATPPDHFLLIEPDLELRRILLTELRKNTSFPVKESTPEDCVLPGKLEGAIPLCRPSKATLVRAALPSGIELITLPITSANTWLASWMPAPHTQLIAVVSHWPEFLTLAQTMLTAAGMPAETLILCDARKPGWRRGLDQAGAILCDAFTATLSNLPRKPHRIIFPVLAQETQETLRHAAAIL